MSYFAEIQDIFLKILKEEEDISVGVAAIKTLLAVIEQYKGISPLFFVSITSSMINIVRV